MKDYEKQEKQDMFAKAFVKLEIACRDVYRELTYLEKEVLRMRSYYGSGYTYKEIGEELGMGKERIRQIEAKAMKKLKDQLFKEDYATVLDKIWKSRLRKKSKKN